MKIINLILTLLLGTFAAVQYNDPDGFMWIILYLSAAIVSGFAVAGKYNIPILMIGIMVSVIGLALFIPDFIDWVQEGASSITKTMKTEDPHIELVREFLGLAIVLTVFVFHYFKAKSILKAGGDIM